MLYGLRDETYLNRIKQERFDQDRLIPIFMSKKLTKILQLDPAEIKEAKSLRVKSIDNAINLSKGPSRSEMHYHALWTEGQYEIGVGKPGKETETSNKINPNINDMWPYIRKDGQFTGKSATFDDIDLELERSTTNPYALELLGCLIARSGLMLDHIEKEDKVVYTPPKDITDRIAQELPVLFNVPLNVFLQYLDAIALNEDVKYQRRLNGKGKPYSKAAGRPNNLLTSAHLIAVLLGRTSIVGFATGFSKKRGVSPLDMKHLSICFPMLEIDKTEAKVISEEIK